MNIVHKYIENRSPLCKSEEVGIYLRCCKAKVQRMSNPKDKYFDPTFPKRVVLGSRNYFRQHEVESWLKKQGV